MIALTDSGYYLLLIHILNRRTIRVGRRGRETFPSGWYVYIGSARRNLGARLDRHRRKTKRLHWHIDYLLAAAELKDICVVGFVSRGFTGGKANRETDSAPVTECGLAAWVAGLRGAALLHPGFGASDCRCPGHLYFFEKSPEKFLSEISSSF